MNEDRIPPNALEVERTLLGTFLIDNVSLAESKTVLPVSAFYGSHHREIYSAMIAMSDKGQAVDMITIIDTLNSRGSLEKIGGDVYIAELCEHIASKQSIPDYMRILSEKYVLRNVIETCERISSGCYEDTVQIQKVLAQIEHLEATVSEDCEKGGIAHEKKGLVLQIKDIENEVIQYRRLGKNYPKLKTVSISAWPTVSEHYKVARRMLNIWTGIPSHGKSEIVDALMMHMAIEHNWKWAVFSPENYPVELHVQKLCEKLLGKWFFNSSESEILKAMQFITDHFVRLEPHEDFITIDALLDLNQLAKASFNIDGVVWDPFNEITLTPMREESKTDYIGRMLGKSRRHARRHDYLMNIVAHPTKIEKDKKTGLYPVPTPYNIDGSANWYNKADNCFAPYRNFKSGIIDFHIQKIKFKIHGKIGVVQFRYDVNSGRFNEIDDTDSFTQDSTPVRMDLK